MHWNHDLTGGVNIKAGLRRFTGEIQVSRKNMTGRGKFYSTVHSTKSNPMGKTTSIMGALFGIVSKYGQVPSTLMRLNLAVFGLFPGMRGVQSGDIYLGTLIILAFVFSFMVLFFWLIAVIIELFRKKS